MPLLVKKSNWPYWYFIGFCWGSIITFALSNYIVIEPMKEDVGEFVELCKENRLLSDSLIFYHKNKCEAD